MSHFVDSKIPSKAGIGLRFPHYQDLLEIKPDVGFIEVHSENYFAQGGASHHYLQKARELYPLSFHGVGLSLGSYEEPSPEHMQSIKRLVDQYDPGLVSEHISWNITGSVYLNDLLPLPYTEEALEILSRNVQIFQDFIGRQVLLENPSAYLSYEIDGMMNEPEFIQQLVQRSGCGLLLDVNNVYVSAQNMKSDAEEHLMAMPFEAVQEIHLAGHAVNEYEGKQVRIDDHGSKVCDDVWRLYEKAISRTGSVPTLIEWDTEIPKLNVLVEECEKAQAILNKKAQNHAA